MKWMVSTEEEWAQVAAEVAAGLQNNILLLQGEMGAGKTTFTRALMKTLGVEDEVSSPTYALVNEYAATCGNIYHFDLFRVKDAAELEELGFQEYLEDGQLSIIEWPDDFMVEFSGWPVHRLTIIKTEEARQAVFE